jgi:type I restriction enzyme S subunit
MSGLQRTTLGECCEIVSGATPSTSVADYWDGDICWATPKDLSDLEGKLISRTERRISDQGLASCAATVLPPNSVLFSSRAPIGHVAINTVSMATNQGFKSFVPDANRVEPSFLYHWLRAHRAHLESLGNGATFKEVSKAVVSRVEIELQPLPEQRRIADILDKADAIRRKRKQAIALTEELLRSAFLEMFGDPVTNPKGWPVKPLGELLAFLTSGSRGWAQHYADSGETFLRIQNVRKDLLDLSDVAFVHAPDSAEARRTETKPGDVLLSITADLGRTAVVPASLPRAFINQHLAILRPRGVNAEYLSAFLASEGGQLQINRRNKGGVKAGLNFDDIRSVEVLLPPVAAQEKFATAKARIRATNADIERALLHDDDLFNSLVARAFSGEFSS